MAKIRPFAGVRPAPQFAKDVASLPYDVMSSEEARDAAKNNPHSFLRVEKSEIDLPASVDLYDVQVYRKAKENLERMLADGVMIRDSKPCYYIYRIIMGDVDETGIVAGASVEDYENDIIKKHELTRAAKEDDRTNHVNTLNGNAGPVFLTYPAVEAIDILVKSIMDGKPEYDFTADDNIRHLLWVVNEETSIEKISNYFSEIKYLYVADGHHRSAAATRVCQMRRKENPKHTGNEEYNYFLSVIFPHNQLYIMDYNRIVKDLNGYTQDEFLKKIAEKFSVESFCACGNKECKPSKIHEFGMYLGQKWYKLTAKENSFEANDPIKSLDVSILQENLLHPILGIGDPRKDERIDFVGGIRGLKELAKRVDNGEAVAFAMFATSIEELMAIADAGKIMPPKSTWFEPKLRSGVVVHVFE